MLTEKKKKLMKIFMFPYSIKLAREIRKFHVAIVQRRLSIVPGKRDARAVVVLLIYTYCFFAVFVAIVVVIA